MRVEVIYFGVELKPCPFCGGDGHINSKVECHGHGDFIEEYYVECDRCGCRSTPIDCYDKTKGQAMLETVERWNRRVSNE